MKVESFIRPARHCNFLCKHCFNENSVLQEEVMPYSNIERFLTLISNEFSEVRLVFHGGEPTLAGKDFYRNVFDFQNKLRIERGVSFSNILQTNGFLLDSEYLEILQKGDCKISLSFDGPHNSDLRSHTDEIYEKIKLMKNTNIDFAIICVETEKSISNLMNTYNWFKSENIQFEILAIYPKGFAKKNLEFKLDIENYITNLISLYKYWITDKNCVRVSTFHKFLFLRYDQKFSRIWYDKNRFSLNSDGKVYVYGYPNEEKFALGHVNEIQKLTETKKTAGYINLKKLIQSKIDEKCENCTAVNICGGVCISKSLLYDGDDSNIDYSCEMAMRTFEEVLNINEEIKNDFKNNKYKKYNNFVLNAFGRNE